MTSTLTGTTTAGQPTGRSAIQKIQGPSPSLLDCLQEPGLARPLHTAVFQIL